MAEPATRTVDRALDLLAVVSERGEVTLTECARDTGLAASTALRLLRTLESAGFVARDEEGVFRPGHRLIQLGAKALSHDSLASVAGSSLRMLAHETGESTYLCVSTADQGVLYIAQAEGSSTIRHVSWVGHRFALDGSAAGRALRGEIGESGHVSATSVIEPDVIAVAAPVRASTGVVAAISLVGPAYRMTDERVDQVGALLVTEAERVSALLGGPDTDPPITSAPESNDEDEDDKESR